MNARFKFRVWDKENHCFIMDKWPSNDAPNFLYDLAHNDNFVIQQSTGLRDREANLIFEGDYVLYIPNQVLCNVGWDAEKLKFEFYAMMGGKKFTDDWTPETSPRLQIKGNIFEGISNEK